MVCLGVVVLGEAITILKVIGIGLILSGAIMIQLEKIDPKVI
jgi:multidrug transporter EmrE-like cation transporter